jgi:hypothetical protein
LTDQSCFQSTDPHHLLSYENNAEWNGADLTPGKLFALKHQTLHHMKQSMPFLCRAQDFPSASSLVDAYPIFDHLDPFRDGKVGQRIGENIAWYLESLDQSLIKNEALRIVTNKYSEKWYLAKVEGVRVLFYPLLLWA